VKRGLALFLVAAFLPGCGSDDGDDETAAETTTPPADRAVLESNRIGFTFEYPDDLVVDRRPRPPVLARVAVNRRARLNAIQVRQTARRELRPTRYLDEFRRDLERSVERVETREDQVGDLDVGVLEVEGRDFTSSSYFFAGAARTWQLECLSNDEHRAKIDEACEIALGSIAFSD
jgi:hypothetical protein